MNKPNKIRTYPIKSLCIFISVVVALSIGMIILMAFLSEELFVVRILVWIMCGIFVILGSIVLYDQFMHYFYIKDDKIVKNGLFFKKKISFKEIFKIRVKDEKFIFLTDKITFCEIPTEIKGATEMILYLEKSGVKIDWSGN